MAARYCSYWCFVLWISTAMITLTPQLSHDSGNTRHSCHMTGNTPPHMGLPLHTIGACSTQHMAELFWSNLSEQIWKIRKWCLRNRQQHLNFEYFVNSCSIPKLFLNKIKKWCSHNRQQHLNFEYFVNLCSIPKIFLKMYNRSYNTFWEKNSRHNRFNSIKFRKISASLIWIYVTFKITFEIFMIDYTNFWKGDIGWFWSTLLLAWFVKKCIGLKMYYQKIRMFWSLEAW